MTGTLLVALSIIVLVGGTIWAANRWGRAAAQRDRERRRAEIASDQARAAVDAPRTTRTLVERLRRGDF
jgi:hypothetical protein